MKILILVTIYCIIYLFFEIYAYQAIKTLVSDRKYLNYYKIINLFIFVIIFYFLAKFDRSSGMTKTNMYTTGVFILVLIPKMVISLIMFGEDFVRMFFGFFCYFNNQNNSASFLPSRRKFISQIALGVAAVPFLSLIYGMTYGKYNFKVIRQQLFFDDLPADFDGFTITQISDIHSGSFDNPEKINYAIDLINQQNSDLFLFTGDIVNTHAKEMFPWIDTFNKIKQHPFGKFSVLGNHDYGEYVDWNNPLDKHKNFEDVKNLHQQIGFDLLLNANKIIKKGDSQLVIVGVENWGHNFKQAGDLNKASENLTQNDFKILMSHDPSHWEYEVKDHPKHFQLTLSGHTHGMQFGIEIPGVFKWSPVQYVYKQWAGLYENLGRNIYVNRGFGFHAYPGRVGIMPEITVIELKKGKNVV